MNGPTMHTDPSGAAGGLLTIVAAALTLLVAFGLDLTPDQEKAILGFVATAGPALTAYLIRRKAFAPTTVEALLAGETTAALVGLDPNRVALIDPEDRPALEAALLQDTTEVSANSAVQSDAADPYPEGLPDDLDDVDEPIIVGGLDDDEIKQ